MCNKRRTIWNYYWYTSYYISLYLSLTLSFRAPSFSGVLPIVSCTQPEKLTDFQRYLYSSMPNLNNVFYQIAKNASSQNTRPLCCTEWLFTTEQNTILVITDRWTALANKKQTAQISKGIYVPKWLSIWQSILGIFSFFSSSSFRTGAIFQITTFPESWPADEQEALLWNAREWQNGCTQHRHRMGRGIQSLLGWELWKHSTMDAILIQ